MSSIQKLIIDCGGQYTLVIGRTLRELGVRSIILPPKKAAAWLKTNKSKGIILSGGNFSVYSEDAPHVPAQEILEAGVPILGICYGMQWLAHQFDGTVMPHWESKEYGKAEAVFDTADKLFSGLPKKNVVWASHGDSVAVLPKGFRQIASSEGGKTIAAMVNRKKKIWGVQFHPEVVQTPNGKKILARFLFDICGCQKDWYPQDVIAGIRAETVATIGSRKALVGFSGGVDSSTLAAILSPALGKNLLAVCIDTGGLRQDELREVRKNAQCAGVALKVVSAAGRFQKGLGNTVHSEAKRRRFKRVYGPTLQREALAFGGNKDSVVLVQGTLATDIIESGLVGEAQLIKSHHNVGLGLQIPQVHPFRNLFKYEVRELAEQLGLPECISKRQPFPGPGLYVRVVGKPARPDKLAIVRWADEEVARILKKHKLYHRISQLVVGLDCLRTVGIKGDERVYGFSVVVRAVQTSDFMTAVGYQIPAKVRREIDACVTKHPKIVRVYYNETHKPPATTELE
ncbi:MAG: glutamine-hydrolyzing GMP synthase [Candidatus Staskawiczbacteria bacterium]|nr:glutamine-hydrolyzing GMP synthase [Candidatus Staskawiczbacteria bacterium]